MAQGLHAIEQRRLEILFPHERPHIPLPRLVRARREVYVRDDGRQEGVERDHQEEHQNLRVRAAVEQCYDGRRSSHDREGRDHFKRKGKELVAALRESPHLRGICRDLKSDQGDDQHVDHVADDAGALRE